MIEVATKIGGYVAPASRFYERNAAIQRIDDDYYSTEDGLAESTYVYIEGGTWLTACRPYSWGNSHHW